MQLITNLNSYVPDPRRPLVLAVGNFDGVHLGHQELIRSVVGQARRLGGKAGVLTFSRHPQNVLRPSKHLELLTSMEYKLYLLEKLGIQLCFFLPFTEKFSQLGPAHFVEHILVRKLKVSEVCLGGTAHFGHDRKGNADLMRNLAAQHHFRFKEARPVKRLGHFLSSTHLRALIRSGKLEEARKGLGRPFSVLAKVVRGAGRGKHLGFPTANLKLSGLVLPPEGVYPVKLRRVSLCPTRSRAGQIREITFSASRRWYQGVLNYGKRPTFYPHIKEAVAEVFILGFEGNLYGHTLEISFSRRLRGEKTFENAEALKRQIGRDIGNARRILGRS